MQMGFWAPKHPYAFVQCMAPDNGRWKKPDCFFCLFWSKNIGNIGEKNLHQSYTVRSPFPIHGGICNGFKGTKNSCHMTVTFNAKSIYCTIWMIKHVRRRRNEETFSPFISLRFYWNHQSLELKKDSLFRTDMQSGLDKYPKNHLKNDFVGLMPVTKWKFKNGMINQNCKCWCWNSDGRRRKKSDDGRKWSWDVVSNPAAGLSLSKKQRK